MTGLALIGGFFVGIVLSELIGILGVLVFHRAVGIRFLPIYSAFACAAVALIVDLAVQSKSRKPQS